MVDYLLESCFVISTCQFNLLAVSEIFFVLELLQSGVDCGHCAAALLDHCCFLRRPSPFIMQIIKTLWIYRSWSFSSASKVKTWNVCTHSWSFFQLCFERQIHSWVLSRVFYSYKSIWNVCTKQDLHVQYVFRLPELGGCLHFAVVIFLKWWLCAWIVHLPYLLQPLCLWMICVSRSTGYECSMLLFIEINVV
jgi:hypothetical protein